MAAISMKKISKKELDKIRDKKILIIDDIRKDYEILVEHVSGSKEKGTLSKLAEDEGLEFLNSNQDLLDVILERKDSKYAALTVELASVMEDFLQKLFKASNIEGEKYDTRNKPRNKSIIEVIESKLKDYINIENEGDLELLNAIRNKIIHNNAFSFRKAKKETNVQRIMAQRNLQKNKNSKDILLQLIIDSEEYIKSITVK